MLLVVLFGSILTGTTSQECAACTRGRWRRTKGDKSAQYVVRGERAGLKQAARREDDPPSPWTLWRWEPDDDCRVKRVTLERACSILAKLKLRRLLVVGDSLSYMQVQSLSRLLGLWPHDEDVPVSSHWASQLNKTVRLNAECRHLSSFEFSYLRNDYLTDAVCGRFENKCLPWFPRYEEGPPTLLVVNTGAHAARNNSFEDRLARVLPQIARIADARGDVALFRTSFPGHPNCTSAAAPLSAPPPAIPRKLDRYHWNAFAKHSAFLRRALSNRTLGNRIGLLDVLPMTALRPDGHRPEFADCLHYYLPSVVDWWSHLLFAKLDRLGAARSSSSSASLRHAEEEGVVSDFFC